MKSLEDLNKKPEKGSGMIFLAVGVVGVLIAVGLVALMLSMPTHQEAVQATMDGALREGNPEFDAITRRIVTENDAERTMESPTGMGTIQMSIWGRIKNLSDKTITGLEVKVTVVDLAEKPVKEKTEIIIPKRQATLGPTSEMPVNIMMDGFSKEDNRANIRWKVTGIKTQ